MSIGLRQAPQPDGQPGHVRVDTVHQGDRDGEKGVYLINLVDEVTQFEFVGAVVGISERFLVPLLEGLLLSFPFPILGFHADNGSEYINHRVAALLEKLRVGRFTKSRARHSNDNALVEGKNANVIRKWFGHDHIPQRFAPEVNRFAQATLSPFLNFHRPCLFATEYRDNQGRIRRKYLAEHVMTPYAKLRSLADAEHLLKPGVHFALLDAMATAETDLEAVRRSGASCSGSSVTAARPSEPLDDGRRVATSGGGTVLWSCGPSPSDPAPRPAGRVDSPWITRQARVDHRLPTLAGLSPTTPQDRQPIFSHVVCTTGTHAFDPVQSIGSKSPKSLLTSEASPPIIPSSRKRHPTSTSLVTRPISPSLSHWTAGPDSNRRKTPTHRPHPLRISSRPKLRTTKPAALQQGCPIQGRSGRWIWIRPATARRTGLANRYLFVPVTTRACQPSASISKMHTHQTSKHACAQAALPPFTTSARYLDVAPGTSPVDLIPLLPSMRSMRSMLLH